MPRPLDLDRLKHFGPASQAREEPQTQAEGAEGLAPRWPSREPVRDGQISIKAPLDVISRFKKICKEDRRTYADMLQILMDGYEGPK